MNHKHTGSFGLVFWQITDVLFPLFLHFAVLELTYLFFGEAIEPGVRVTLAAVLTAAPLTFFYRRERRERRLPFTTLWIPFLAGIAGNYLFSWLFALFQVKEHFSDAAQEALFQSLPLVQIVGLGMIVPIVEELIFRGMICGKLEKYYGQGAAILFSALIFAFYHGNMVQILYAFPMGLLLAWVYLRWGTLAAPVLLHIGANLFGVIGNLTSL